MPSHTAEPKVLQMSSKRLVFAMVLEAAQNEILKHKISKKHKTLVTTGRKNSNPHPHLAQNVEPSSPLGAKLRTPIPTGRETSNPNPDWAQNLEPSPPAAQNLEPSFTGAQNLEPSSPLVAKP